MANQEHIVRLTQSAESWNKWRKDQSNIRPNLSQAKLSSTKLQDRNLNKAILSQAKLNSANLSNSGLIEANLIGADLTGAILSNANFTRANLSGAQLIGADLCQADFTEADLIGANLTKAKLNGTVLKSANLLRANLSEATLNKVNLTGAVLNDANLSKATLASCSIYGVSAWKVQLEGAKQSSLIISQANEPTITVESLNFAQFLYLLQNNEEIRDLTNVLTSKLVLILGRFTLERKKILEAISERIRYYKYFPVLFDFEKPGNRDFTEMVNMLAHMSRFIIADLTEPSSVPHELMAFIPLLAIPVQPLLHNSAKEYALFQDLWKKYPWVLPIYRYGNKDNLLASLKGKVIDPAEKKAKELERWKH